MSAEKRRRSSGSKPHQKQHSPKRVLIVCEGSNTEPAYLRDFCRQLDFNLVKVSVKSAEHPQPQSVLDTAKALAEGKNGRKFSAEDYDQVFCVFDRDEHASFADTVSKISRLKKYAAITSTPCFEIWILSHYERTAQEFQSTGRQSACDQVIARIKSRYLPDYSKRRDFRFTELMSKIDAAEANVKAVEASTGRHITDMPELIECLRKLSGLK